jgi:ADP-ribosylglycohydrolase
MWENAAYLAQLRSPDRVTGMLMGCAIGDALGMAVEGPDPMQARRALDSLGNIREFLAPQPFAHKSLQRLRPGCWTDETQMLLSLTRSLVAAPALSFDLVVAAHVHAFETFEHRGWDVETKQACRRLLQGTAPARSGAHGVPGNTAAAKMAPLVAALLRDGTDRAALLQLALEVTQMTHRDSRAVVGAYLISLLVAEALWAEAQLELSGFAPSDDPLSRHLEELSDALDCPSRELAELSGGAGADARQSIPFCVALLCGRAWDFDEGVTAAVMGGGDADTNGAIVGTILGIACGVRKMPRRFVEKIEEAELIRESGQLLAGWLGREG